MREKEMLDRIQAEASNSVTLFRNNTGTGWAGEIVEQGDGYMGIRNPRPLEAGLCVGSSDLIGWEEVEITKDMVGIKIARFVAIEAKTGRVVTTDKQRNFLRQVQAAGGRAELIREKKGDFVQEDI